MKDCEWLACELSDGLREIDNTGKASPCLDIFIFCLRQAEISLTGDIFLN